MQCSLKQTETNIDSNTASTKGIAFLDATPLILLTFPCLRKVPHARLILINVTSPKLQSKI